MRKAFVLILTILLWTSCFAIPAVAADNKLGFDVTKLGARGNDTLDDTKSIQNALNKYNNVYIPAGTYLIDVKKSLMLKSNQTLTLDKQAVLKALPTANSHSAVLNITNVSNVKVTGGQVVGERYSHQGTTGEWGMGVLVESSANNVNLSNMTISDCWGDGIYLGGTTPVNAITLDGVVSSNNRRQGLSITNATNITISNSVFKNTNGTAPQAGIDIEPNPGEVAHDIKIINTSSFGNAGSGLDLMGENYTINHVSVQGSRFSDNASIGIRIINASDLAFSSTTVANNYFGIDIPRDTSNVKFTGMQIRKNKMRGVSIVTTAQARGIDNITFENSIISNNSQLKAGDVDGIRIDNFDLSADIKNIIFTNCKFIDDQTAKTQRYGLTVGFSKNISNIVVNSSNVFSGNVAGGLLGSNTAVIRK